MGDRVSRFAGANVIITGGSSGIGLETAVAFGRLGARLFLVARDADRLGAAAEHIRERLGGHVPVVPLPADVGSRAQIQVAVDRIGRDHGGVHVLINNAGVLHCGRFEDHAVELLEEALRVNYLGMVYALKAAWPHLKASGDGHVGFVSSLAGVLGLTGYSAYAPAKFAVVGLAECLRMEGAACGIGVTVVFPPDTATPMLEYESRHALPESRALSAKVKALSPEQVARAFVDGIVDRRFEVFCNLESRMPRTLKAVWPWAYYRTVDRIAAAGRGRVER